ncbi:hypothetical protein D3C80_2145000 [compost metagenome]
MLGFRQIAELALLKLEGEFSDFSGVLLLITSGVDQLNLALVAFLCCLEICQLLLGSLLRL